MYKDLEKVKTLSALISPVMNLPVFYLEDNGMLLFETSGNKAVNPVCDFHESLYEDILDHMGEMRLQVFSSKYLENFLVLPIRMNDARKGYLVFGPSIAHMSNEKFDLYIDFKISQKERNALTKYLNTLTIMNYHDLIRLGICVYYMIYDEVLDFDSVNTVSNAIKNVHIKAENESTILYRDINYLQRSSHFERYFFNLIKSGEVEKLKELLKSHSIEGEYIVLAKNNPLRSWKNLAICFITISCRAAMSGGLPTETSYALTDVYIQELEELRLIRDVEDLLTKVFIDLAERVEKLRSQQYSKLITQCQEAIAKNLGEDITLASLAKQLKVNGSYLSDHFKKEVGVSLGNYILDKRISEAKRMLLFTQFSILDIYTSLGFCDQSHFTKAFKKATGLTPKQFRNSTSSSTLWD